MTCIFSRSELITLARRCSEHGSSAGREVLVSFSLRDFPSLGYSAVRDVLTVDLQLPAYPLMNHIGIPLSSLSAPHGHCWCLMWAASRCAVSLSPSLLALFSAHSLLLLGAEGIFMNAQNAEKKYFYYIPWCLFLLFLKTNAFDPWAHFAFLCASPVNASLSPVKLAAAI